MKTRHTNNYVVDLQILDRGTRTCNFGKKRGGGGWKKVSRNPRDMFCSVSLIKYFRNLPMKRRGRVLQAEPPKFVPTMSGAQTGNLVKSPRSATTMSAVQIPWNVLPSLELSFHSSYSMLYLLIPDSQIPRSNMDHLMPVRKEIIRLCSKHL